MSRFIYQTEGFVIKRGERGETGLYLLIFSKELGLIWVEARGIRNIKSKLRAYLNLYSLGQFSLVATKTGGWRLVGAESKVVISYLSSYQRRYLVANWALLINRFLDYNEKQIGLYNDFISALDTLAQKSLTLEQIKSLEAIFILRLLSHLGYRPLPDFCHDFLIIDNWQDKALTLDKYNLPAIINEINKSISFSDL